MIIVDCLQTDMPPVFGHKDSHKNLNYNKNINKKFRIYT